MLMELLEENVISLCMYKNKSFIDSVPINAYENKGLFFPAAGRCLLVGGYIGYEAGQSIAGALRVGNQDQTFYAAAGAVQLNPFIHPPELTGGHTGRRWPLIRPDAVPPYP